MLKVVPYLSPVPMKFPFLVGRIRAGSVGKGDRTLGYEFPFLVGRIRASPDLTAAATKTGFHSL